MKSLHADLLSHLAGEVRTLATCWKLTRGDSVIMGFTDHDVTFDYDRGDGDGAITYKASTGFTPTSFAVKGNLSVDTLNVGGPFGTVDSEDIREADLIAGLYDEAVIEIFMVNYKDVATAGTPTTNPILTSSKDIPLTKGNLGEIQRLRDTFVAEMRSLSHYLQQQIGEVYTPYCRADLGDSRCGVTLASFTVSGEVTAVTSNVIFDDTTTAGITGAADNYFNLGLLTWTSGDNNGLSMEVKDFDAANDRFTLVEAMPYDVQVGDTFDVYPGCDKSLSTCINTFNNVINFRGEPYIPGSDYLATYPDVK